MFLDVMAVVIVLAFAANGRQHGGGNQFLRFVAFVGVVAAAGAAAGPVADFLLSVIAWSRPYAIGLCFSALACVFHLVIRFSLEQPFDESARESATGRWMEPALGMLFGAARGALLCFMIVAVAILLTRKLGAGNSVMALQFQKSTVGRTVMLNNWVDPDP